MVILHLQDFKVAILTSDFFSCLQIQLLLGTFWRFVSTKTNIYQLSNTVESETMRKCRVFDSPLGREWGFWAENQTARPELICHGQDGYWFVSCAEWKLIKIQTGGCTAKHCKTRLKNKQNKKSVPTHELIKPVN